MKELWITRLADEYAPNEAAFFIQECASGFSVYTNHSLFQGSFAKHGQTAPCRTLLSLFFVFREPKHPRSLFLLGNERGSRDARRIPGGKISENQLPPLNPGATASSSDRTAVSVQTIHERSKNFRKLTQHRSRFDLNHL